MRKPKMAIRVCYNFLFLFQQIWMKIYINRCESPPALEYYDGLEKVVLIMSDDICLKTIKRLWINWIL